VDRYLEASGRRPGNRQIPHLDGDQQAGVSVHGGTYKVAASDRSHSKAQNRAGDEGAWHTTESEKPFGSFSFVGGPARMRG
jgi:hypothetical protein